MRRRKILLVDDDDDIREVAQLSLELTAGWDVASAASGEEGLRAASASPPDAILLDVMMPGMDGPTTLRALRADPRTSGIPVVLLTAKVQAADRRRLETLGADGLLAKPFDPTALADQVSDVLGWS
jgi:CheY-like chemotaxis protein